MSIDWDKIEERPDKDHKVRGYYLLNQRQKVNDQENQIAKLDKDLNTLRKQYMDLKDASEGKLDDTQKTVISLKDEIADGNAKIDNLDAKIKENEDQINSLNQQISNLNNMVEQKNADIKEFQSKNSEMEKKVKTVDQQIEDQTRDLKKDVQKKAGEIEGLTKKVEKLQKQVEEGATSKDQSITEFKQKHEAEVAGIKEDNAKDVQKLKAEIDGIKEKHRKELVEITERHNSEMSATKSNYTAQMNILKESMSEEKASAIKALEEERKKKIKQLKEKVASLAPAETVAHHSKAEDVAYFIKKDTGDMPEITLVYKDKTFVPVESISGEGIYLQLDRAEKWLLLWDDSIGLVERRTAERQARSIAKSGFSVGDTRWGAGWQLEILGSRDIPERLTRDQHKYMD